MLNLKIDYVKIINGKLNIFNCKMLKEFPLWLRNDKEAFLQLALLFNIVLKISNTYIRQKNLKYKYLKK